MERLRAVLVVEVPAERAQDRHEGQVAAELPAATPLLDLGAFADGERLGRLPHLGS